MSQPAPTAGWPVATGPASPMDTALVWASGEIARGELRERIDAAARTLAAHIEPGTRVAICAGDPAHEAIAACAIVAAGGVFVPLDAGDPRLPAQLAHSGARAIVVSAPHAHLASGLTAFPIDAGGHVGSDGAPAPRRGAVGEEPGPEASACVLYRASPDRLPRGVVLPRRALAPPVFGDDLDLTPADRVALPMGFAQETTCTAALRALNAGACVIDIGAETPLSPRAAAARLRDRGATVLVAPLALVERLARQFPWALRTIRLILSPGGLDAPRPPAAAAGEGLRSYTIYGCAETGGYVAVCRHDADGGTTIRTPRGTRLVLRDETLQPVDEGDGHVCVMSDRLALEYHEAPEPTARAFVTVPVDGGMARVYRSGDRARRGAGETLYPLGRGDRRVLVNDRRVEPAEIEAALEGSPRIACARVAGGVEGLAATVTPAPGERMDADDVDALLRASLPAQSVPGSIAVASQEPQSDLEQALAAVWAEVLQKPQVGLHANFFDLGGHSMKLVRVAALLQQRLGVRVTMVTLFAHPTIHKLAKHLAGRQAGRDGAPAAR